MKIAFVVRKSMEETSENCPYTQTVEKFFVEYCDNSSIHGVRYITERNRHWSERFGFHLSGIFGLQSSILN